MTARLKKITRVPKLPRRVRDAHKGDFGRMLVIGGSPSMPGAAALCANAALRSGAGLVRIAVEGFLCGDLAALAPCATFIPYYFRTSALDHLHLTPRGPEPVRDDQLREVSWNVIHLAMRDNDAVAIGPGWGVDSTRHFLLERILNHADRPLVIDADGLNNLTRMPRWTEHVTAYVLRGAPIVLTPHPGEMQRLLEPAKIKIDVAKKRVEAAAALAKECGIVVVLKGAGTVVADPKRVYVNRTGNPGMATGGTGDVLTGVIAALIGQKMSPFDAAVLGVQVHGIAGDLAARKLGQISMMASDILDFLPEAFIQIHGKR